MKFNLTLCLFLGVAVAEAANLCVRSGATGANNGLDWNNAFTSLPASATVVRGNVYYVAEGDYSGLYIANKANSGTSTITFKKATPTEHGPSSGWSDSYADGVAIMPGRIECYTQYYVWDGSYRAEQTISDWMNGDAYGFWFRSGVGATIFQAGQLALAPGSAPGGWTIKYCRMGRDGGLNPADHSGQAIYVHNSSTLAPWTIQNCGFIDVAESASWSNQDDWLIEKCAFYRSTQKCNMRGHGNSERIIIRNNFFLDCGIKSTTDSTGGQTSIIQGMGYFGNNDWQIYGNIFHCTGQYPTIGHQGGAIGAYPYDPNDIGYDTGHRWKVYNNVFSNLGRNTSAGKQINVSLNGTGHWVCNNVWVNSPDGSAIGVAIVGDNGTSVRSNNWFYPSGGSALAQIGVTNSPSSKIGSQDPFIDSAGFNFLPKAPSLVSGNDIVNAGVGLAAGLNTTDPLGNVRGSDGAVDIGPFEWNGVPQTPDTQAPTAPSNVQATPVSQSQINLTWTVSADNVSVNRYIVRRNGVEVGSSFTPSFSDTGLSPGTTYSYRIVAVDGASNVSTESTPAASATTLAPDTAPPTVPTSLTATAQSSTSILLTWEPSTDNIGVTGYRVYRGGVLAGSTTVTNFTSTGLNSETEYTYTVSAVDGGGNESAQSGAASATTEVAPALPVDDLEVWLRADTGVSINDSLVYQWNDQSGNGRHASQVTLGDQPRIFTTPSNTVQILNGWPVLYFDGEDDFMTLSLPINGLTGLSIFIVSANLSAQAAGNTEAERAVVFWNETAPWGTVYVSPFQSTVALRFGTTQAGNRHIYTRPSSIGSAFSVTAAIKNGTTDSLYVNGAKVLEQGGKLTTIAGCVNAMKIGQGYNENTYFHGSVAEILIYTRAVTAEEREGVESYLASKYFGDGGGGEDPPTGDVTAPTTPTNLSATPFSPTRMDLTWTASTDDSGVVDHYILYRGGIAIANPASNSYSDAGLSPNTSYTYRVVAVDGAMNMSAQSVAETESTPELPASTSNPIIKGSRSSGVSNR